MLKICLQLGIAARAKHADQALDRPSSAILLREAFNQVLDSGKRLIEAEELGWGRRRKPAARSPLLTVILLRRRCFGLHVPPYLGQAIHFTANQIGML
jgi:hypothetical protein